MMAKSGRRFKFHGAFASKEQASRKEKRVRGFIQRVRIRGATRYLVLTRKG
jgi:hypothetical protein